MGKDISKAQTSFLFCDGGSCQKAKSEITLREARAYLRNQGLWDEVHTIKTRCNGRCEDAPTCIVQPGNFWYKNLTPEKAVAIVKSHTQLQRPVQEYLLYQEGWTKLNTTNERTITPPIFQHTTDPTYGEVLVARAFASDQHLYPLFQFLFQEPRPIGVQIENETIIQLTRSHQVDYTDPHEVHITGDQVQFALAIAPLPKTIDEAIAARKVSVAEVIWLQKDTIFAKAIRLKNKKGKPLVTLWIHEEDSHTWEHILKIYLAMTPENPRIAVVNT